MCKIAYSIIPWSYLILFDPIWSCWSTSTGCNKWFLPLSPWPFCPTCGTWSGKMIRNDGRRTGSPALHAPLTAAPGISQDCSWEMLGVEGSQPWWAQRQLIPDVPAIKILNALREYYLVSPVHAWSDGAVGRSFLATNWSQVHLPQSVRLWQNSDAWIYPKLRTPTNSWNSNSLRVIRIPKRKENSSVRFLSPSRRLRVLINYSYNDYND